MILECYALTTFGNFQVSTVMLLIKLRKVIANLASAMKLELLKAQKVHRNATDSLAFVLAGRMLLAKIVINAR